MTECVECTCFLGQISYFSHLRLISDHLIVSIYHKILHDPRDKKKNVDFTHRSAPFCVMNSNITELKDVVHCTKHILDRSGFVKAFAFQRQYVWY